VKKKVASLMLGQGGCGGKRERRKNFDGGEAMAVDSDEGGSFCGVGANRSKWEQSNGILTINPLSLFFFPHGYFFLLERL